jgi:methionyl-tRNA formyltransferase
MHIVIYTSDSRSSSDNYNISHLLNQRKNHKFSFVIVKKKVVPVSLWLRFKRFIVDVRDGKNHWVDDLEALNKKINTRTLSFDLGNFDTYYVHSVNDSESENIITQLQPDIILQAGAGILKNNVFSLAKKATINVHHGLAPDIRGIKSTFWCLYYGLTDLIGVTCHKIDKNLDTGAILSQYRYPYTLGDSFLKVQEVLCQKGLELLIEALDIIDAHTIFESVTEEVTSYYFSNVDRSDYNALKANGFLAVKQNEIANLKTKKKIKTIIKPELY